MIRSPYSINEKTSLVSIPISINKIKDFNPKQAKISAIETTTQFFQPENSTPGETKQLLIQALDFELKNKGNVKTAKVNYEQLKIEVSESFFPECIQNLLKGIQEDGRKRAVFILISFLQNMGWSYEKIQEKLLKWNEANKEPLRDGYILTQISWFKKQQNKILPPNCDHESYYKSMGIKCGFCKYKNPVNYVKIKLNEIKRKK